MELSLTSSIKRSTHRKYNEFGVRTQAFSCHDSMIVEFGPSGQVWGTAMKYALWAIKSVTTLIVGLWALFCLVFSYHGILPFALIGLVWTGWMQFTRHSFAWTPLLSCVVATLIWYAQVTQSLWISPAGKLLVDDIIVQTKVLANTDLGMPLPDNWWWPEYVFKMVVMYATCASFGWANYRAASMEKRRRPV